MILLRSAHARSDHGKSTTSSILPEAVEHKSGWGWHVMAILPDGQRVHIVGFRTEAEAKSTPMPRLGSRIT